jgi:hypothetical protein
MDSLFQSVNTTIIIAIAGSLIVTLVIIFFVFRMVGRVTGAIGGMNQKTAQLLVSGASAQGTVTALNASGMMVNYNPVVDITLDVQPMDGSGSYTATVRQIVPSIKLAQVQPGMTIGVKYNPSNRNEIAIELR